MANKTVFDTNIWISYFLKENFEELIRLRSENKVLFLRSTPSIEELQKVISRKKFEKNNFNVAELMRFYTGISDFCETQPLFNECADVNDNFLFDLAIQGNADYLVSGDKKVLETPFENKAKVCNLTTFKAEIKG